METCRAGHLRTPENTYVRPDGKGRICLPCRRQQMSVWYSTNRERQSVTAKAWDLAHPGQKAAAAKAWQAAHPNGRRKHEGNRRGRIKSAFVESIDPNVVFQRDGGLCQLCESPIGDGKWHIDHIVPLARGGEHSYSNVQLAHAHCNLVKGTRRR